MSKPNPFIVALCLVYAGLTGCGTKGPLYIPEQRYPQKEPAKEVPSTNSEAPLPDKAY